MFSRSSLPASSVDRDLQVQIRRQVRGLIAKALTFFEEHEADNLSLVREHLLLLRDARASNRQAQNLRSANILLDRNAKAFNEAFRSAIQATLHEEAALAFPGVISVNEPAQRKPRQATADFSVTLIERSEVERAILLDRVTKLFTAHYEVSLTPLTERLSALRGQGYVSLSCNPFRPEIFVRSFLLAWERCDLDPLVTEDLMLSLDPRYTVDLALLYEELNTILFNSGVAAQSTLRIRRTPGQVSASTALDHVPAPSIETASVVEASSQPSRSGMMPDGLGLIVQAKQFLQRLGMLSNQHVATVQSLDTSPQDAQDHEPSVRMYEPLPVADAEFLGYLANLQADADDVTAYQPLQDANPADHNILRQIRDMEQVRRAPDIDRGTVDALAEVFDYVFTDKAIPVQLKFVIGRLQIPVLKAAMIDRDFFLSAEHPARRLVDTLAQASIAWTPEKGEADPLYQCIESTVQRVLTEFEDDLNLFRELLQEFNAFLFETEQQVQGRIEPVANQERDEESYQQALVHADEVVHARINALPQGAQLAPFLVPFLTTQWREVLARAWQTSESDPKSWERALNTLDQLIWSTQPKNQPEERRQLVAVLPELVRNLNEGLDANGWNGQDRSTFTQRLITTHTRAIRMTHAQSADTEIAALEESAGQEAMQELDARLAAQLSGSSDEFDAMAQSFARGLWFDFVVDADTRRRYRLSWVSPMRTRLLFTNRDGFDAFVRSEREVAQLLRQGHLIVIDQEPIVARALDHIMASDNPQLAD